MTEVLGLQQKELPYYKRWFRHSEVQLFVWELDMQIVRFAFSFNYQNLEYVFLWDADKIQDKQRFLLCLSDNIKLHEIDDFSYVSVRHVLNDIPFQPSIKASQIVGSEKKILMSIVKNNLLSYGEKLPCNIKHYVFCALWYSAC
ncbi:hypothetical protein SAMN02745150_00612 [Brevinema andersonii]|uniref:Uncharacterized protein n=1 Tax=Brevinema andersonii TaxID=34097 RepID=A0A1I1DR70_BREAD|nr:hypothetical protein [Brevinema andersonii]SFB75190.1 hypothetical protein SAMN02745150_00612 [Brevinema andersonii]